MQRALDKSEREEAFYWKETRNWMTVYNKFYSSDSPEKSKYPQWFDENGEPRFPDKFIFRIANLYGDKKNSGNYDFNYDKDRQINDLGFYIREEMSFGVRNGSAKTISDEKRTVFNKIIGVNTALDSAKKDKKNYLFNYYIDAAVNPDYNQNSTLYHSYLYTNPSYSGGWDKYEIPPYEDLGSVKDLYDYYKTRYKDVYGLENTLRELRLLSDLAKAGQENYTDANIDAYVDFNIKEAVSSTNYENGDKSKPLVTKITFGIKDAYFNEFIAAFPNAKDKYDSIFAGADYVSVELILGKVSQIVGYVRDINPTLGIISSPVEAYTLYITYLGPKIKKPAYNANGKPWYENLNDQW
jgi:hypothetical protein